MPRPERRWAPLALLLAAACAGATGPAAAHGPAPRVVAESPDAQGEVERVLEALVTRDGAGGAPDSLFAPDAIVLAGGNARLAAPRLAGVQAGGQSAITASQISVRDGVAWGVVDYRWFSTDQNLVRLGRATVLLLPRRTKPGWWIAQLHSDLVR